MSTGFTTGRLRGAIVVVNYGSSELLAANLVSLSAGGEFQTVVVDNPTTDRERAAVRTLAAEHGWRLIEAAENLGFGSGVNLGAKAAFAAGAEVLLILNPDAQLAPAAAQTLLAEVAQHPEVLAAPMIRSSDGKVWFCGAGVRLSDGSMVDGWDLDCCLFEPWLTGACLAVARGLWERIGGFDPDYFLYWEDVDLSRKVREAGGQLVLREDVNAIHDEGGTQGRVAHAPTKSDIYYYYNVRNRMLYAHKHLTPAAVRRWERTSATAAQQILLRGGRRQLLRSRSPLAAVVRGLWDGLRWRSGVSRPARPLVALQTYPTPLPFHNPFVKMLDEALARTGEVRVRHFTWQEALLGSYDVVHGHWPEDILATSSTVKGYGKRAAMAMWLARLAATRTPIVRTVHNLELPRGLDLGKRLLLEQFDRQTAHRIVISESTPPQDGPTTMALHGHYRDWFGSLPAAGRVPGRVAYFGMVRRYKNVEALARVFVESREQHPEWSLEIAGNPSGADLVAGLNHILEDDPRVSTTLRYLRDEEVARAVTAAQLVVLPYKEMHNSGSLLTALSLNRPCLVPDAPANRAIAAEVGPGWVYLYDGELDGDDLERVMAATAAVPASAVDLHRRDWDESARLHVRAYRAALRDVRGH